MPCLVTVESTDTILVWLVLHDNSNGSDALCQIKPSADASYVVCR